MNFFPSYSKAILISLGHFLIRVYHPIRILSQKSTNKMAETATLAIDTTAVNVDIDLLEKEQANLGKEDASLDSTLPTSCDSSQDQPSNSCDADSVEDSLGPHTENSIATIESRRVSFSNVEVRGKPSVNVIFHQGNFFRTLTFLVTCCPSQCSLACLETTPVSPRAHR